MQAQCGPGTRSEKGKRWTGATGPGMHVHTTHGHTSMPHAYNASSPHDGLPSTPHVLLHTQCLTTRDGSPSGAAHNTRMRQPPLKRVPRHGITLKYSQPVSPPSQCPSTMRPLQAEPRYRELTAMGVQDEPGKPHPGMQNRCKPTAMGPPLTSHST